MPYPKAYLKLTKHPILDDYFDFSDYEGIHVFTFDGTNFSDPEYPHKYRYDPTISYPGSTDFAEASTEVFSEDLRLFGDAYLNMNPYSIPDEFLSMIQLKPLFPLKRLTKDML